MGPSGSVATAPAPQPHHPPPSHHAQPGANQAAYSSVQNPYFPPGSSLVSFIANAQHCVVNILKDQCPNIRS